MRKTACKKDMIFAQEGIQNWLKIEGVKRQRMFSILDRG